LVLFFKKELLAFSMPRGNPLHPGADPTRLATGLNLRAISVVEGVRAGLAAAVPVAASLWLHQPVLTVAALGALLTCIVDPAGPMRRRLPLLTAFVMAGGLFLGGFGLIRQAGIATTIAAAAPLLLACAYARVWGQPAQAFGNLLAVVLLLGTDDVLGWRQALGAAAVFIAGGAWALLLTLAIWRIHPYGPARRAVADVWAALADLTRAMRVLAAREALPAAWEAQARGGRGAVREAIERARTILMETVDARGPSSGPAAQNLMRLEAADQVFAALIGLSDVLETLPPAQQRQAVPLLRRLRGLLAVLAGATETEHLARGGRFDRSVEALRADASLPAPISPYAQRLADRLRVATKLIDPAQYLPGSGTQGEAGLPFLARVTGPLLANLNWRSASLRHAVRTGVVVSAALTGTLIWHGAYTHWLTITLVLVMQPFFATTWQRSLERVGGTLFGGVVAALLSALMQSRVHTIGLLPVLGALALAVRQVSYAVYIAVYTPTVILLVESIHPAEDQLHIAAARAGFTVLGGLIAVAANILLWPTWEPDRVRQDLRAALAAHAAYAAAVLGGNPGVDVDRARRAAGLASNNLEASLARVMQEPRRGQRDRLQAVLVADATLRRIAGRLTALALDPPPPARRAALGAWAVNALTALTEDSPPPPSPAAIGDDMLDRLARQVQLLPGILARLAEAHPAPS
jgi:uncharacterized membrane protein YccC